MGGKLQCRTRAHRQILLRQDAPADVHRECDAARAGSITKLEVKVDDNRTICELHLEDAKGKNFETQIDVAANKVLRIKD